MARRGAHDLRARRFGRDGDGSGPRSAGGRARGIPARSADARAGEPMVSSGLAVDDLRRTRRAPRQTRTAWCRRLSARLFGRHRARRSRRPATCSRWPRIVGLGPQARSAALQGRDPRGRDEKRSQG
jgi:hypothetical protein